MKRLPLYAERAPRFIEQTRPLEANSQCRRCDAYKYARHVCIKPVGEPGGVLVVDEAPLKDADLVGALAAGRQGKRIYELTKANYQGPIALTTAVRCYGGNSFTHAEKCRGYLAQVIHDAAPERVILLGKLAQVAVFGPKRVFDASSVHGAYNWLFPEATGIVEKSTPVFILPEYSSHRGNKFLLREWSKQFVHALKRHVKPFNGHIRHVTNDNIDEMLAECRAAEWVAFDVEHYGTPYADDFEIFCGSVSPKGSNSAWMWLDTLTKGSKTLAAFIEVLKDPRIKLVLQNGKSDIIACHAAWGVKATGLYGDTRLWSKLLDVTKPASLALMCEAVGMGGYKQAFGAHLDKAVEAIHTTKRHVETRKNQVALFATHDPKLLHAAEQVIAGAEPKRYAYRFTTDEVMTVYNARDSVATARLGKKFERRIKRQPELWRTWEELVRPATEALLELEMTGAHVSREAMTVLGRHLDRKTSEMRRRMSIYGDFNPDSPEDLHRLLYEKLDLPIIERTATGQPSTAKPVLKKLRDKHPVVEEILEWRRLTKLKGTYVDGMFPLIRDNGRIHPTFNIDGARTGRLSCSNPNLMNLPRAKDKEGPESRMIKQCFTAPDGKLLISCDFSQIELRVAAAVSGDKTMSDIYRQGIDFHQRTAQLIAKEAWGLTPDQVEPAHRDIAKVANFLSIYGGKDSALARSLGCSIEDAARVRQAILRNFTDYAEWVKEQEKFVRKHGYVWVPFVGRKHSRRRALFDVASNAKYERSKALNGAANSPIQGMASDICLASLVKIVKWFEDDLVPARAVLIVHDDIIVECDEGSLDEVAHGMRHVMTSWDIGVPLEVEAKYGKNWGSMEKYSFS